MSIEEQPGSEAARNFRIQREIECLWVIRNDEFATVDQALAWASLQEGWACEGIRVPTLKKRIRELALAGYVEYADKKHSFAKLTEAGRMRLASYIEKATMANKWEVAKRRLEAVASRRKEHGDRL